MFLKTFNGRFSNFCRCEEATAGTVLLSPEQNWYHCLIQCWQTCFIVLLVVWRFLLLSQWHEMYTSCMNIRQKLPLLLYLQSYGSYIIDWTMSQNKKSVGHECSTTQLAHPAVHCYNVIHAQHLVAFLYLVQLCDVIQCHTIVCNIM